MNYEPDNFSSSMPNPSQLGAPPKQGGCWKAFAIGCCVLVVVAAVGGYFVYRGASGLLTKIADRYTSPTPMELPVVEVSDSESAEVLQRVAAFSEAVRQSEPSPPLVLSSRDVNVLINRHPEWKVVAGSVYITIENDRVKGDIALPLDELGGAFKGRFLNGSALFRVDMAAGRLLLFLDSVEVAGKPLPNEFMNVMRANNLAEGANQKPAVKAVLEKLQSITVRDGTLIIVPKPPSEPVSDQRVAA